MTLKSKIQTQIHALQAFNIPKDGNRYAPEEDLSSPTPNLMSISPKCEKLCQTTRQQTPQKINLNTNSHTLHTHSAIRNKGKI